MELESYYVSYKGILFCHCTLLLLLGNWFHINIFCMALENLYNEFSVGGCCYSQVILLPFFLQKKLILFSEYKQKLYSKVTLKLLDQKYTRWFILKLHVFLLYFRYFSVKVFNYIETFVNLNTFAILISAICSRLHIAGWMIAVCLVFIRLDFSFVSMARFYRDHPGIFERNFPQIPSYSRGMWSQTSKIALEAASNPQVQAIGLAVGGALLWKSLDVYETLKQEHIAAADRVAAATLAEADRVATATLAEADRVATAIQAEADRVATAIQAQADRVATAAQAEADRCEENKRSAFAVRNSSEFNNLSDEQKENLRVAIETGILRY